jgi:hypothetical protein
VCTARTSTDKTDRKSAANGRAIVALFSDDRRIPTPGNKTTKLD